MMFAYSRTPANGCLWPDFIKETIKKYLKNWKIIGVAFSGDINDEYNHRLDTYIVKENEIQNINKNEILDENDYFAYFENIDLEKISNDISRSSSEINRLLRNLDSQKRPILLSALMIWNLSARKSSQLFI